ncbi:hypothetical protein E2C01_010386 [Portunus trituberculatus]|uniref:Uncharacterized protein n=1 Tax=Portunus trituberculatus TaxID=210409 RepID=A0A5B7D8H2_PORTR|nr:hypothetical protein [Portunus trituberculatus]
MLVLSWSIGRHSKLYPCPGNVVLLRLCVFMQYTICSAHSGHLSTFTATNLTSLVLKVLEGQAPQHKHIRTTNTQTHQDKHHNTNTSGQPPQHKHIRTSTTTQTHQDNHHNINTSGQAPQHKHKHKQENPNPEK